MKRCFKVLQTISKRKQNKNLRKVDLNTCLLAFALHKCVMVIVAAIYTLSRQHWRKVSLSIHTSIPTPNIKTFFQIKFDLLIV